MQSITAKQTNRPGAVAPFVALMLIPLLAMVAFGVDVGWIVLAQSDLQDAADAAALAGAGQLMNGYVQYNLPNQTNQATILSTATSNASTYAKNFAGYNSAGGVSSLTLRDADIEYGFMDASGTYTPQPTYKGYPNTVRVTMRLDSLANNPLKLFFGPVLGVSTESLTATASATIYTANITNFQQNGFNAGLLPMTLDINAWNNYLSTGQSSDGAIHANAGAYGSSGAPQMQIYPSPNLAPGNFGMLSLDNSSNDANSIRTWITSGLSAPDLQTLQNDKLLPLPSTNPKLWDWKGAPGFKASDLNTLTGGGTFLLPLFEPVVGTGIAYQQVDSKTAYQSSDKSSGSASVGNGGTGQNAYYNIYKFVGVIITQVDKSSDLYVQPYAVLDPAAVFDTTTVTPAGTTQQVITTFTTPKLSR
jgi:Flp pilus assembly protein TadG